MVNIIITVGLYDCHTHTKYSHDSQCDMAELFETAIKKGVKGITFTDHCDIECAEKMDVLAPILKGFAQAQSLKSRFEGNLKILSGVEIGGVFVFPEAAAKVLRGCDFDAVVGSVHEITNDISYSRIDFSNFSQKQIDDYLQQYFNELLYLAENGDYDILAHMTCPLRYIVGKYGKKVDMTRFIDTTDKILQVVIDRGKAMEINTSGIGCKYGDCFPSMDIVKRYFDKGGRIITIGSDAHVADNVGNGFEELRDRLIEIGFTKAYYFEKREKHSYSLI